MGYLLAAGIPVVGAFAGLLVGNHFQKAVTQTLTATYEEKIYLQDLESKILHVRVAKDLGPYINDPGRFRKSTDAISDHIQEIQRLSKQLESSQTPSVIAFSPALSAYQKTLDDFSQDLNLLAEYNLSNQRSVPRIEQRILSLARSNSFRDFIQFSDQVKSVIESMDQDIASAQQELSAPEKLRMQIVLGSLLASVLVASWLAIITSRMISRPLESLTDVAHTVIRDEDMTIRASVSTKDEIGMLAITLNQLIEWVQTYTKELQTAQLQLIQAEKMSSVGQLVAGVAHEINNPVGFIHGNINPVSRYTEDLLDMVRAYQKHYPNPPESLQEILEEIDIDFIERDLCNLLKSMKVGTTRIRDIVLSLRNFSRLDESDYKFIDLHEGIDNALLIVQHRLTKAESQRSSIEVVKSYADLPLVECLPGAINQVLMNLIVNAIDTLEAVERTDIDERQRKMLEIATRTIDSDRIQILIADNGEGMTDEVRSRIFDPFFTTKPVGKGTGLGLSISYQIITEQHGGSFVCESTLGEGTRFLIEIPNQRVQSC